MNYKAVRTWTIYAGGILAWFLFLWVLFRNVPPGVQAARYVIIMVLLLIMFAWALGFAMGRRYSRLHPRKDES
jgi:hypothetical protein